MKRVLSLAAVCAVLLFTGRSADAAIMVVSSVGQAVPSPGGASTQTLNFDATGGDKLVVAVTAEENGGGPLGTPVVTYNTVPLTPAITQIDSDTGQQFSGIFYLDNPASGVNEILVDWGSEAANGVGFGVFTLVGAAVGDPSSTGFTTSNPGTIALGPDPAADSFALAAYVTNGSNTAFGFTGGSGAGALTEVLDGDVGSARAGIAFQNGVGGPTSYGVSGGNTSRPAGVGAAFAPVPEPAGVLLAGFAAAAVAASTRRRR